MTTFTSFAPYDNAETMDSYIDEGKQLEFSRIENLFRASCKNCIAPAQTIVCRYYDSLKVYIETKTFTDAEFRRYKYNPRFLSYDLYGTPELWADILYINNMVSVSSFNKSTVKVFRTSIIDALIEIKSIIENDLIDNKRSVEGGK